MASLQPQCSSSSTPCFMAVILNATCTEKLEIPKKFVMEYGGELSDSACLKIPSGSEWEVELARCNGEIWFEKGWPEFSVFCSLEMGYFLVFRYEGNSKFHVCILDLSKMEIDYPVTMPKIEETGMAHSLTTHEALQRANAFRSNFPSFTVGMQPSYVSQRKMRLPSGFGKRYLLGSSGNVILRVSDGKTWSMNLFNFQNSTFSLQSGWLSFVKDNILEVGDACVFMLKDKGQLLFDVIFFRNKESANDSLSPGKSKTSRNCGKVTQRPSSSLRENIIN